MASIEQRGENTYRIVVSVRKGNRFAKETKSIELSPNLTDKQKEKELKRLALLFEEDVKKGNYLDGEKITFADFTEIWLREYAEKELEPATLNPYKMRLEKRILPAIGHLKLTKIQPQHLISFYNNLTEEGIRLDISYLPTSEFLRLLENVNYSEIQAQTGLYRRIFTRLKQGKGIYLQNVEKLCEYFHIDKNDMNTFFVVKNPDEKLSAKTIRHHHNIISGILSTAVSWNLILYNPAQRVKLSSIVKAKSPEAKYYNDEQTADLLMSLADEPIKYVAILYLTIDTGLRLSEVAGLKWDMVDLDKKIIEVEEQRQYVSHYGIIEKGPKSECGLRRITISKTVSLVMVEYKKHQSEMKLKCGTAWYASDFVFTHDNGIPIFPNRPSVWFKGFIEKKGLPPITFHGLRHTNASILIAEGIDIVTLSKRLGHADKNVTLNTYSHVIESREKMMASKMDDFYERVKGAK